MINTLTNLEALTKRFSVEWSVHAVIVAFAFGSITNVYSYFVASGHDIYASAAMAVALGTALATSAIMATKINMRKERKSFVSVLAIVSIIGLVSGYIQMNGYMSHGIAATQAVIMGFGVPIAGELLLALALAISIGAMKRTKIHEADQGLEEKIAATLADALDDIDPSKSTKYIQRHIDSILRHKMDEVVANYVPALTEQSDDKTTPEPNESTTKYAKSNSIADHKQEADQKRTEMMNDKLNAVREYFMDNPNATQADAVRELSIPKSTMSGYVKQLNGSIRR